MSDRDRVATDRVLKARGELILTRRFYGVLVSNVEPVLTRQHPTMATDGKRHYFNPDFIVTLTQQELLAVQAHESEHDARHHGTRRNGRDPVKWNEACDYAINIDLVDQGFTLPKGALLDGKYRGMSAEDIYRARELDAQQQRRKQEDEKQETEDEQDDGLQSAGEDEPADSEKDEPTDEPADVEPDSDEQEDDVDGEQGETGDLNDCSQSSDDSMPGGGSEPGDGENDGDEPSDDKAEGEGEGE